MKRFVCALLILCLLPVCAFGSWAEDPAENFNIYAELFGAPELDEKDLQEIGGKKVYTTKIGFVGFDDKSISVTGNGETFLIYAMGALSVLEKSNENFTDNCGLVLSNYLMCRLDGKEQYGITKGNIVFLFQTYENGFLFVASR